LRKEILLAIPIENQPFAATRFPFRYAQILFTTTETTADLFGTSVLVCQMILKGALPAEKFGHDLIITAEGVAEAKKT